MLYAIYRHEAQTDYLTLYAEDYATACDTASLLNASLTEIERNDSVFYFAEVIEI